MFNLCNKFSKHILQISTVFLFIDTFMKGKPNQMLPKIVGKCRDLLKRGQFSQKATKLFSKKLFSAKKWKAQKVFVDSFRYSLNSLSFRVKTLVNIIVYWKKCLLSTDSDNKILQSIYFQSRRHGVALVGLAPQTEYQAPQMEIWNTINHWSFYQISISSPLVKTFWRRFCIFRLQSRHYQLLFK